MSKWFSQKRLLGQIRAYYLILFAVIFIVCVGLYVITSNQYTKSSENSSLEYGMKIAESNMRVWFDNATNCSKSIAYSDTVQEILQSGSNLDYEHRLSLQKEIVHSAACFDGISSIFLFDTDGNAYVSGEIDDVEVIRKQLMDHSYFDSSFGEADSDKATSIMTFSYEDSDTGTQRQVLSFVRLVRELNSMESVGVLVVNIPGSNVADIINTVSKQTGIDLMLYDSDSNEIIASQGPEWVASEVKNSLVSPDEEIYKDITHGAKRYRIGIYGNKNDSWIIAGMIQRNLMLSVLQPAIIIICIVFVLGILLGIIGASYITAKITRPLSNILISMESVGDNHLQRVVLIKTNYEMDNLQEKYNHMLDELENLMSQKVEEQRMRKKYELSLLQEQIKPHFLYNTFDSVCALAKLGRTEDVYTMMQALGQYYRSSLHKGQTVITVQEELSIVENYLVIQSFRYDDVFEVVYDVDESVKRCKTIKLILQPLVENAIYHGFRENDLTGTIVIRAKDADKYVKMQVEDNGIGIEPDQIEQMLHPIQEQRGRRFGLPGTIQRINLYYNCQEKNLVEIESTYGSGTTITIWIPKEGEKEDAERIDN